jgi:hypothetical protein
MRHVAKSLALAVSMSFVLACATIGPPQPPSLDLPQPPSDLRALRKGDRVSLTWTVPTITTDRATVRGLGPTMVCRGRAELSACDTPVGEVAAPPGQSTSSPAGKAQASYADPLPPGMETDDPSAFATYAVQVLNREHRGAALSNQVQVSLVRTLAPPRDFRAQITKQGVVLSWTGDIVSVAPTNLDYVYRVYRHAEGSNERALVGEVRAGLGPDFSMTDANIEWEKTYDYRAQAVTQIQRPDKTRLEVEGDDTPELSLFAHDVFPPTVPGELQAVFSGPGQKPFIDLVWAPVMDADLAGYNVYRREQDTTPVKVNAELVKTPAFRDDHVTGGKKYLYSVTAVDIRDNESAGSEEATESVP